MGRAPCCDKANVKRGPWSPEEDAKLKSYIEKHGTGGNWIALPQKIGLKRCGKSCRLRWLNYLRPNIRHGGFSEEEDNIICSLYLSIGSRWSIIASQLPGRTDNDIKNYWNTRLKKKLLGKQLRKEQQQTCGPAKRMNMILKQEVDTCKGSNGGSLLPVGQTYNQNVYWPDLSFYNFGEQSSSSLRNLLPKLDGRFSNEENQGLNHGLTSFRFQQAHEHPSLGEDIHIPQLSHNQYEADTKTSLQTLLAQGSGIQEIAHGDEFLYTDSCVVSDRLLEPMTCGESNTTSWGYFSPLVACPPPHPLDHFDGFTQRRMMQDRAYSTTGLKYEGGEL